MRDGFKMPKVALGDIVLWRHNRVSPEPAPAVVTGVGDRAISLSIVVPGSVRVIPKDGVRHDTDPEVDRVLNEAGVWGYTETGLALAGLFAVDTKQTK